MLGCRQGERVLNRPVFLIGDALVSASPKLEDDKH
jgi:hypothetical protein